MSYFEEVIGRLKKALDLSTTKELAQFLEVANLSSFKQRETLPYRQIIERSINNYYLDFIFHGIGEQKPSDKEVFTSNSIPTTELEKTLLNIVKYGNKALIESIDKRLEELQQLSRL